MGALWAGPVQSVPGVKERRRPEGSWTGAGRPSLAVRTSRGLGSRQPSDLLIKVPPDAGLRSPRCPRSRHAQQTEPHVSLVHWLQVTNLLHPDSDQCKGGVTGEESSAGSDKGAGREPCLLPDCIHQLRGRVVQGYSSRGRSGLECGGATLCGRTLRMVQSRLVVSQAWLNTLLCRRGFTFLYLPPKPVRAAHCSLQPV